MFKKILQFIKYNNAMVLILVLIFVVSSGVFAQTDAGQEFIGGSQSSIQGHDNTLLLEADLDNLNMDYRIEKIEQDDPSTGLGRGYYYVTYTFLDLMLRDNAWEYVLTEKVRKVSQTFRGDLGEYLAEELSEEYNARLKELNKAKALAERVGTETRIEVELYSGLIGQTLELASKVFPDYEPVKVREVPSPSEPGRLLSLTNQDLQIDASLSAADDLTSLYDEYIERMDPDGDDVFGALDNCPDDYNPKQMDLDLDGIGDFCDLINDLDFKPASSTEEIATSTDETASSTDDMTSTDDNNSASTTSPVEPPSEKSDDNEPEVIVVDLEDMASSSN